jgi:PKHD-type hydroxylase
MIYIINLLDSQKLTKINNIFDSAEFETGLMTRTEYVPETKTNLEMSKKDGYYLECEKIITSSINQNYDIKEYTSMRRYGAILFSQYKENMFYDVHNDYYKMGAVRTDYSCTVFLSNPDDYEGGELMIDIGDREVPYKLNAGDAVVYPTGLSHRVNMVKSGTRRVCVFWIESSIQNNILRDINSEMYTIMRDYVVPDDWKKTKPDLYHRFVKIKFNILRNFGNFEGMI